MTDNSTGDNVSELPCGGILIARHAPTVKIGTTKSEGRLVIGGIAINGSIIGPSIRRLQASGNARVVKARTVTIPLSGTFDPEVTRGRRNVRIITPPSHGLRDAVRIVLGRRFLKDVIEPTMADVDHEYYEAIIDGNDRQARAIKWFGLVRIALVVLISPILRLFDKLRSIAG